MIKVIRLTQKVLREEGKTSEFLARDDLISGVRELSRLGSYWGLFQATLGPNFLGFFIAHYCIRR